jgi:hypothetical protein
MIIKRKDSLMTEMMTLPEFAAYRVITAAAQKSGDEPIALLPMLEGLLKQAEAVNSGNLRQAEAMLICQATALQSLFAGLTEKAMSTQYMPNFEAFMRMALRAQSQCRATIETLSAIKNPPIVYAKQANIAHGHQQVNNDTAAPSREREIESEQTKLSGGSHELLPDTRASRAASRIDPALATVGEIDRAKVGRG